MAVEPLVISQFVAAGAMLLLAGWLLFLNFRSPVNRSFAAFLLFRAIVIIANRMRGFAFVDGDGQAAIFWEAIREYYYLALAPALLYFWLAYSGGQRASYRLARVGVVAVAVLVEGLYAYDHCLNYCTTDAGLVQLGPLSFFGNPGYVLAAGFVGLALLLESFRRDASARGAAAFPVALGLLATAVLEGSFSLGLLLQDPATTMESYESVAWARAFHLPFVGGLLAGLAGVMLAFVRSDQQTRPRAEVLAFVATLASASGLVIGLQPGGAVEWLPGIFLFGLWRILLPALVAYALVRHRLFGVDVKVRFAVRGTTLAGIFLAAFFVVNKITENVVAARFQDDQAGVYVGGAVAGLLLFAISPLQRVAERLSQAIVPHARPVATLPHPERIDLYRQQAALVWSDGTMGRKERALLDALRIRLALPVEDAVRLEAEAAAPGSTAPRPPRTRVSPTAK